MFDIQVCAAVGTRAGKASPFSQDAIGINGWAFRRNAAGVFPPWGGAQLSLAVTPSGPAVFVVSDGLAGEAFGGTASLLVAELASDPLVANGRSALCELLNKAHSTLLQAGHDDRRIAGMGATVVGVVIGGGGELTCFNVGDSRCYYENAGTLVQATRDDVQRQAFSGDPILANWIGKPPPHDEVVLPELSPFSRGIERAQRRRLLLCSDGLYKAIDEQGIQDRLCDRPRTSPAEIVAQLLEAAQPAEDDATALVLDVFVQPRDRVVAPKPERQRRPIWERGARS